MNSFVIANPNKCLGCRTCEIACVDAHTEKNIFISDKDIENFNPRLTVIKIAGISAPVQCRQCEDAACLKACPNGSITMEDGLVKINRTTCIGCKTCVVACPFGAMTMAEEVVNKKVKIVANKCDLCFGREAGPACVEICPTKTLTFVKSERFQESVTSKREESLKQLMDLNY